MTEFCYGRPVAIARLQGGPEAPRLSGTVTFFPADTGTIVVADVAGLPVGNDPCASGVFGFHIHEGTACTGEEFADTGGHFNPGGCPHPYHAGDLPPLFSSNGQAYMAVLSGRFRIPEVLGRTVVIHSGPDDFTTQPAGNSGKKIACGVIRKV